MNNAAKMGYWSIGVMVKKKTPFFVPVLQYSINPLLRLVAHA